MKTATYIALVLLLVSLRMMVMDQEKDKAALENSQRRIAELEIKQKDAQKNEAYGEGMEGFVEEGGRGEEGIEKGDVFKRLANFSTSEGHHIATLIKDMQQSELSLQANIGELSKTLEAFGRKVNDDPEFISWNRKLASLKTDRVQLKGMLEEAFIWSENSVYPPVPNTRRNCLHALPNATHWQSSWRGVTGSFLSSSRLDNFQAKEFSQREY